MSHRAIMRWNPGGCRCQSWTDFTRMKRLSTRQALVPLFCFHCHASLSVLPVFFTFNKMKRPRTRQGSGSFVLFSLSHFFSCTSLFVLNYLYSLMFIHFFLCQHLFVVINVFSRFIRCSMFIRFHQVEKALFQVGSFNIYFSTLNVSLSIDVWMFILYF